VRPRADPVTHSRAPTDDDRIKKGGLAGLGGAGDQPARHHPQVDEPRSAGVQPANPDPQQLAVLRWHRDTDKWVATVDREPAGTRVL
jgi:hypothetical protein